jgi:antitoxin (DNA-binding transcriptional repressor) of toxin-antitoxin stability system
LEDRKDFDLEHRLLMPDGSITHVRVVAMPKEISQKSMGNNAISGNTWRQRTSLSNVATCGYNLLVTSTGIRELKDNLSRYIRRIEAGERIAITAHGRVVAELVPPGAKAKGTPGRFDELVASGVIRPPLEAGDPTEGWPDIRLPAGTAAELIDADRGEA